MTKAKLNAKTIELRRLMKAHGLSCRQVAAMVNRSRQAVKRWTAEFTIVDQSMLELLKFKLESEARNSPPKK